MMEEQRMALQQWQFDSRAFGTPPDKRVEKLNQIENRLYYCKIQRKRAILRATQAVRQYDEQGGLTC
jgi:hypothetical protein